jgi:RNA polymerase sigma-70 factor, ECF subfamily
MHETDRALVERARSGDTAAIGELFSRYWRAARAAAFGVTGDLASAEDAAADGFRDAWAGLESLRDPDRFGPWLRTIVIRKARLAKRRSRAVEAHDDVADDRPTSEESPDLALQRAELESLIQRLVRELKPHLREAVSLFYFEGYDSDEAARFLQIPPGTFRRRLHQARRQLRAATDDIMQSKGRKPMRDERAPEIERLKHLMDAADKGDGEALFQVIRGALALRPVPNELMSGLFKRHSYRASGPDAGVRQGPIQQRIGETIRRFTGPSSRAMDPAHPIGVVAAAIRRALHAEEWIFDSGDVVMRILTSDGEVPDPQDVLPPAFAQGTPGTFIRATRAVLIQNADGAARTMSQAIRESADRQTFRAGIANARLSDVLEVAWLVEGPLELKTVQETIERVIAEVLPETAQRFVPYDEPRYRAALELKVGDDARPAATGGVLAEWKGRAPGVDAAHLRLFLEPWATARSGQLVEFDRMPVEWPPT